MALPTRSLGTNLRESRDLPYLGPLIPPAFRQRVATMKEGEEQSDKELAGAF